MGTEKRLLEGVYQWLSDRSAHPGFLPDVENLYKVTNGLLAVGRISDVADRASATLTQSAAGADLHDLLHMLHRGVIDPVRLRDGEPLPFARCPKCENDALERGVNQIGPDDYAEYVRCRCGWAIDDLEAKSKW